MRRRRRRKCAAFFPIWSTIESFNLRGEKKLDK
jgi:hypothetical protein